MVTGIDPRTLSQLAAFDRKVHDSKAAIAAGKRKMADLDALEAEYRTELETAQQNVQNNKLQCRQHESEIEDLKRQVRTHNHRLNEITDTREFRALSDEIRYIQRQIEEKEEQLLKLMEEGEQLAKEVESAQAALEEKSAEVAEGRAKIEGERERQESELAQSASELETFLESIPAGTLRFYKRKAQRQDMPVVWVRDDACSYCHHKLTPQGRLEVRKAQAIVVCESCGRIVVAVDENYAQPSQ